MAVAPLRSGAALGIAGSLLLSSWGLAAAQPQGPLDPTPSQPEGPFYPIEIPVDHDADLTVIEGSEVVAAGEPLVLEGLVLQADGTPVEGAAVEIWQTDAFGVYLHPDDPGFADRDPAFQGFGESLTDAEGAWAFRTILPEVYGGRPRHIHAKVKLGEETVLTTQIYFSGGDIPDEGALDQTGTELDALLVEVLAGEDEEGNVALAAEHILVLP